MKKLLFFIFLLISTHSFSQYADLGTGKLKEHLWWLDWNGFTISNGATKTFNLDNGLQVNITFSNVTGAVLTPDVMTTWSGAVLHQLYNFSDATKKPALHAANTSANSAFTMSISATRNGLPALFILVAADAEGSATTETTTLSTTGSNWSTVEFYRNSSQSSNPISGCNTNIAIISDTYGGAVTTGQTALLSTVSPANGNLTISTSMNKVGGFSGMATAFGILAPVDRGDLPASYGYCQHKLDFVNQNGCNITAPLPSMAITNTLILGMVGADADGVQTLNDNTTGADEEAVSSFPAYTGSGSYSVTVPIKNTLAATAYLTGFFDYNRNGSFGTGESVTVPIIAGTTTATLTWTGLPSVLPTGSVNDFGFRFRFTTSQTSSQSPSGFALDGEVEDYLVPMSTAAQASFTAPDTICVNKPVNLTNTSSGASSHYWNFCVANIGGTPTGFNLGNVNGQFVVPVFMDVVFDNGNYYGFVTNNFPGKLTRLDFGNSLLNTPVATNLGNVGGTIPDACEGIQVIKNEGVWYAIIVGGNSTAGGSRITRINFGANITNNSPVGTNWGNLGTMDYPHDLHIFQDGSNWYGLTVNYNNNTITRFSFGTSFNNTPTAVNLGNIGSLNRPSGINAVFINNKWYVFVSNRDANTLTRLDFGNSLLNTPTGTNLGTIGGTLNAPRDFFIMNFCGGLIGYLVNEGNNSLIKLDFNQNIESVPTGASLGNIGNMSFPVCITKLFRVGADLYTFVTNATNNTISRFRFAGCNNSSIANSSLQNPPAIVYDAVGTYNINLTVDEGLPTQSSSCKQIVVVPAPVHTATQNLVICTGDSTTLSSNFSNANYVWSTGATSSSIKAKTTGTYWVESTVTGGCSVRDSFVVNVQSCTTVSTIFSAPDTVCVNTPFNITNVSQGGSNYYWNFCVANIGGTPTGFNLGNVNSQFVVPVFMDVVFDNGNYYGFVTNNFPGKLTRLDFGNSLLNTPVAVNLGNVGGTIPDACEGIQVIKNEGVWYAIIVGGNTSVGGSRIVRVNFGANITNNYPVGTNWGNLGAMDYPHDLHIFQDGINWYGLTVNYNSNTITRFSFGTSFNNTPTAVNLGNIGSLNRPSGINAVFINNKWYVFVSNRDANTLTRLDFGISLLNTPVGTNLGNPGGSLNGPRDFFVMNFCGRMVGYLVNEINNGLVKLDFNQNIESVPTSTSLGNIGNMSFPVCITKLFRVGADLYTFITNATNNTISRLRFTGCTNASIPNSNLQNPPPVVYNTPGTYNINLSVDEGLSTQSSFCKQVVVVAQPAHTATQNVDICNGDSITLSSNFSNANYVWSTGATTGSIKAKNAGTYWVESTVTGGCTVRDSMIVALKTSPTVYAGPDVFVCGNDSALLNATGIGTFSWSPVTGLSNPSINNPKAHPSINTDYIVTLTAANGCSAKDTVRVNLLAAGSSADFGYAQNICSPQTIQFSSSATGIANHTWDFGNGTTASGTASPTVTYAAYGSYSVKHKVQSANGCADSVTKLIPVNLQQDNSLVSTADQSVCAGNGIVVNASNAGLDHCWSPSTGISNINSVTPTITPTATTTYYFTSQILGSNLVINGDFSAGNTGFQSDYAAVNPNNGAAQYWIGNTPIVWSPPMSACIDHTNGSGQMMMVNGSTGIGDVVWKQTISVTPNNNYAFSTWLQSLDSQNPANLRFSINGNVLGNNINASTNVCQWNRFYTTWNSGNATTATITIVNNNSAFSGNDFALDDISFSQVIMKQDSIKITVTPPPSIAGSAMASTICQADSSQLNASGASNFSWLPTTGLSNPNIANPKASPATTTTYIVSGYDVVGCAGTNTVTVTINPKPAITKSADANICKDSTLQISASIANAQSYSWLPVTGLSNATSGNPLATPSITTNYIVTATGTNGCSNKDSVLVTVLAKPTVQIRTDTSVCEKFPLTLTTNSSNANSFSWLPVTGLSSATNASPVATPTVSTQYIVTANNTACSAKDTINVGIKPLPVVVKSADTIICRTGAANLVVSGGASYAWSPGTALSTTASNAVTANPDATTKYFVTVTGSNACTSLDSITVTVNPKPVFALQPATASICKVDSVLLTASGGNLYAWVPNTNIVSATSASTKVYPPVNTVYKVGITNSVCKVTDTLSATINLNGSLTTSVSSSNDIDCSHGQSTLHATGGVNYLWSAAPGISNLITPSPVVSPTQTTTYYVQVTDSKGCTGHDSVKVNVDFASNQSQYLLPTAFTPDGNGKNDCFGLKYWGLVTQLEFNVYSRWGQLVFHTNNPNDCWDGKVNGQPQDSGTFVYQIKAKTACGEIFRKGTIVLIR